jgi:hypothetical protein
MHCGVVDVGRAAVQVFASWKETVLVGFTYVAACAICCVKTKQKQNARVCSREWS